MQVLNWTLNKLHIRMLRQFAVRLFAVRLFLVLLPAALRDGFFFLPLFISFCLLRRFCLTRPGVLLGRRACPLRLRLPCLLGPSFVASCSSGALLLREFQFHPGTSYLLQGAGAAANEDTCQ